LAAGRAGRAVDRELKRRRDVRRHRGPSQAVPADSKCLPHGARGP
jgi:hypothetical protein